MTATFGPDLVARRPTAFDHRRVLSATETWWGDAGGPAGPAQRAALLPRLFFDHFADTSVVIESRGGELVGFLIGFVSPSVPGLAYVHFTGVAPSARRSGLAAAMYRWFFEEVTTREARVAKCITSPGNRDSIAFHTKIGFSMDPGDSTIDGHAVHTDYDGPGLDRVLFSKSLT